MARLEVTALPQTRSTPAAWVALGTVLPVVVFVAMTVWSARHPVPVNWDEANYALQVRRDLGHWHREGAVRVAKALIFDDVQRPPAYRVLALPAALLFGGDLRMLRATSHVAFLVTLALMWLAIRGMSDGARSALGVLFVAASPGVVRSFSWFGTEYPLFIAIALLLYGSTRSARGDTAATAAGVALGMLAKSSFILVALPYLGCRMLARDARVPVTVGASAGVLIALPWWYWNAASALAYADWGRRFPRAALVDDGSVLGTSISRLLWGTIGIFALAAIVIILTRGRWKREMLGPALAAVLLPSVALLSPFLVERHVAPAILPLTVLVLSAGHPRIIAGGLLAVQILLIAVGIPRTPLPLRYLVSSLERKFNVDWSFLAPQLPREDAVVAFIGLAPSLTPPEITFGIQDERPGVKVIWLWRMEEGPPRWNEIMGMAAQADLVLFPDRSTIEPDLWRDLPEADLRIHNAPLPRFRALLEQDGRFLPCRAVRVSPLSTYDLMICRRRSDAPPRSQEDLEELDALWARQNARMQRAARGALRP